MSIAKARVFAFLLRGRRSRSARFAAGGSLACAQLFRRGVLPRKGATGRALFSPRRLVGKAARWLGGAVVGRRFLRALSAALSLRSVRRRSAAAFLPIRRFHFRAYTAAAALELFRVQAVGSLSVVHSQKCFNRISKNVRLWVCRRC